MALNTPDEIQEIVATELTTERIQAYIDGANALVESALFGKGLPDVLLKEIERWLSAHLLVTTSQRQLEKASAGPAGATFFGKSGAGLNSSTYGQTVLHMDTTGTLQQLNDPSAQSFSIKAL